MSGCLNRRLIGDSQPLKRNHPLGLSDYRNVLSLSALASWYLRNPHARMLSVFSSARTTGSPRGHGRIVDCHSRRDFAQNRVQRPDIRVIIVVVVLVRLAFGPRLRCATQSRESRHRACQSCSVCCRYRLVTISISQRQEITSAKEKQDHLGRETRLASVYPLCAAIRSHRSCFDCVRFSELLLHPDQT